MQWIVDGGIEKGWDPYLADLKAAGLDEFMTIYQAVYDRYRANM